MPEASGNAPIADLLRLEIPRLAVLYDRFAHAIDPFDPASDLAEQTFNSELGNWFDSLPDPKPTFRDFRKHVITLCRQHLRASDKPPSI